MRKFLLLPLLALSIYATAQTTGEVMFVGFDADDADGFAIVSLVPLVNGTTIYFNDNEWNGSPIGGGGAFTAAGEGRITWQNNTGNTISAGTVITITNANATPAVNLGTASRTGSFNLARANETLYMFLGSDDVTPTVFLSAIANSSFAAGAGRGTLINTGMTAGTDATEITGDVDVMIYNDPNNLFCSSIAVCAAEIATPGNWTTLDGGADESAGVFPETVTSNFYGTVFEAVTYYSSNATSGGDWDDPASWTTISDGSGAALAAGIWPASSDNVVILDGHSITVDVVSDNQAAGISADDLARANVGAFAGSGNPMFYQTGNITINNGGTLTTTSIMMLEGLSFIDDGGTFTTTQDLINLGVIETATTASFSNPGNLILSGNSQTTINNNTTVSDDLILDNADATLCGTGDINLGNVGVNPTTSFVNGATAAQICSTFSISCTTSCGIAPFTDGTPSGAPLTGNSGPGGVGEAANNQLWLRAEDLALTDAAAVTSWTDVSGNALAATSGVAAEQPTFNTNQINGIFPSISFDGGDYLSLGDVAALDLIPSTDSWSFFTVYNVPSGNVGTLFSKAPANGADRQYQYTVDNAVSGLGNAFTAFMGGSFSRGNVVAEDTWAIGSGITTGNYETYTDSEGDITIGGGVGGGVGTALSAGLDVLIGARRGVDNTDFNFTLTGSMSEIIMYDTDLNDAQRIIVENYLAAKYAIDISVSGNDFYTMDDDAGEYDFEVAGIGQAADGSNHIDAKGTGVIRVRNPNDLDNSEFLLWGHDNTDLAVIETTDVDGTLVEERLSRVWAISETGGDVGQLSISIDLSSLTSTGIFLGSNLRLLIDRNGNGFADNDTDPIVGSYSDSDVLTFSDVNFQDGDFFTVGNVNASLSLPIDLLFFNASIRTNAVDLMWSTLSEENNDYFTIEKSKDGKKWKSILDLKGAGNSNEKINYKRTDLNPYQGVSYYRLKQTDFDGTTSYSDIVSVNIAGSMHIYPNPTNGAFTLSSDNEFSYDYITLYDLAGRVAAHDVESIDQGLVIRINNNPPGIYLLTVTTGSFTKTFRVEKL